MITVDNKFDVKQVVYVKTDIDQRPNIVTAIHIYDQSITYQCSCGSATNDYCDYELSETINVLATLT